MTRPTAKSLRSRLSILILVSVVPVLVFALIMAVVFEQQQRAFTEATLHETASAMKVAVDRELAASVSALEVLASSTLLDAGDLGRFYEQAARVLDAHRSWTTINLFDETGQQLINLLLPYGAALPFSGDLPIIKAVLASGRPAVSDLFVGPVAKRPLVAIAVPVMRDERVRYILGAGIDVASLSRLLSETRLPPEWVATIIDNNGLIIARTRGIDELLGTPGPPALVAKSREDTEGAFSDVTREGVPVYAVYNRSSLAGWTVGLGIPAAAIDAPRWRAIFAILGGGLLLLLLASAFGILLGTRIARAIRSLSKAARILGQGRVPEARTTGIAEVDEVEREMVHAARAREEALAARARTEEALRESEERTRLLIATALDGVVSFDQEERLASWNPQAQTMFGWSAAEVAGRRFSETLVAERDRASFRQVLAELSDPQEALRGRRIELTAVRRDGSDFPAELAITPIRVAGARAYGAFVRDITERKRREAETVRRTEEPFRLLVDGVTDYAIFMLSPQGNVASWNRGAERITGYQAHEILGESVTRFHLPDAPPGTLTAALAEAERAGRYEQEAWRRRKDGSEFLARIVITPLYDGEGGLRGFSEVMQDITERYRAQQALEEKTAALEEKTRALEAAQEELVRKERLAIVGQLAGGVSHELRNPLGVISNSLYYLKMVLPEDSRVQRHLAILNREVASATRIVTELLDFARVRQPQRALVDLNAVAVDCLERAEMPPYIRVVTDLAPELPGLPADRDQIALAFNNLISNAVQAMPNGGTLTVRTSHEDGCVRVAVIDTGTGIAPELLGKIFEPLFTTKTKGIGLGLPIAKSLIEVNGGRIAVQSTVGQGTRFDIDFEAPTGDSVAPDSGPRR